MTSTMPTPAARISELAATITAADQAYVTGEPLMLDADYDALRDELAALLCGHPELTPADNPLDGMWTPAEISEPVRHARPMLSLAKIAPQDRVDGVTAFMAQWPGTPVLVTPKADGVSASVVYRDGRLVHVATRGDGTVGENITRNARAAVRGIPAMITEPGDCEIRGEIVMRRATLRSYNAANPRRPLANTRNAAAGVIGLKDAADASGRELDFLAFDLDVDDVSRATVGLDEDLRRLGFTPVAIGVMSDPERVLELIEGFERSRPADDIDTDGVVIRLADIDAFQAAGARSNSARGAVAVKYPPEERTTTLLDVEWRVGPGGKVVPRAVLERVLVAGTHITFATLANQVVIAQRGVKIGQRVTLRRAGDVVPFVVGPARGEQPDDLVDIVAPDACPSCASALTVQGAGRELYCTNLQCPAQGARRLMHWASRVAADIDAVGTVWIQRLYDAGILTRPEDFYRLRADDLLAFPGMGEVSARRMLTSIDRSRSLGLRRALIGLGIRHAREGTAKRLCRAGYASIEAVSAATAGELCAVPDVGDVVAGSIVEFCARPETQTTVAALRAAGVNLDVLDEDLPPAAAAGAPLVGETVVITGAVAHPQTGAKVTREQFGRLVEQLGATVASSVSTNTTMLICGANVGASKTAKAEKLGVRVVEQSVIWDLLSSAALA